MIVVRWTLSRATMVAGRCLSEAISVVPNPVLGWFGGSCGVS